MAFLRSCLFVLFFYPGSVLAVLVGFPAAFLGRRYIVAVTQTWALYHRWCARWLLGVRTEVIGNLPKEPVIVAAKHQSMFETIEMLVILDQPAVVMKKQLTDIPGWGWVARRFGVIPVDREGGATALRQMLKAAQEALAAGRPVMIFPEGTRVRPGEKPPLQPGFAGLYKSLKVPVVPIALDSGRIWPRSGFVKQAGTVTMLVGETIPPGLKRADVEERVHSSINALEP